MRYAVSMGKKIKILPKNNMIITKMWQSLASCVQIFQLKAVADHRKTTIKAYKNSPKACTCLGDFPADDIKKKA